MKKFEFDLETVLELRKIKVDEELKKLSIIVGNLNRLQNEIKDNNRIIQTSTVRYSGSDIKTLKLFEGYIKSLYIQNETLQKSMAEQQSILNEARQRVIKVERDAEVLEILKRDAYKEYHEKILKQERTEEEEVSNSEFNRRRRESEEKIGTTNVKIKKRVKKVKPTENKNKSEYEKLMEYAESLKPKK
jgi:flagellar FliJ protein